MWETLIIQPLTNLLLWIYDVLGHGPHMFGLAIILFTIVIKLITWPLNAAQVKGAQAMQELQNDKEWQDIQKKYAKDKEKLAQEQMRIYKDRGINPFASCLPTLVQFPIIIGLYQASSAPFSHPARHAETCPHRLSVPERREHHPAQQQIPVDGPGSPESIQVLGFALPTLAIIVALTTWVQTKLTMPTSSNPNDQSATDVENDGYLHAVAAWLVCPELCFGISVYFIISNILGVVQYAATGRANWNNLIPGGRAAPTPAKKK
jgi:YidC/Oxa1 family membrane protein insertase